MNATDWNVCTDPPAMLRLLAPRASDRKLQLFAAACCRRALILSTEPLHRQLVEASERRADGLLDEDEFEALREPVAEWWARHPDEGEWSPYSCITKAVFHARGGGAALFAARFAAWGLAGLAGEEKSPDWIAAHQAEEAAQCGLLRDIFGDPSRPFRFDPDWLAGRGRRAAELAREIEEARRYSDLPLLADELERAGCADRAVLDHCRAPGMHVHGCWVVDALLGRESTVREGLMTEEAWRSCDDPVPLLHFLRGKGTDRRWRLFAVECCRRIDDRIVDERSRRAVEVAERYAEGRATEEELAGARAGAQAARDEAKRVEYSTEAEEDFRLTPRYAAACRDLFASEAARGAVGRDPRASDEEPGTYEASRWRPSHEWAVATVQYHYHAILEETINDPDVEIDEPAAGSLRLTALGKLDSFPHRPGVEAAAEAATFDELRAQCEILRDLFGDVLGPPGDEGGWLPFGEDEPAMDWWRRRASWWCRFPTPRRVTLRTEWLTWAGGLIPRLAREIDSEGAYDRLPSLADALQEAGCDEPVILDHLRGGPHFKGCWVLDLLMGR
jgi:hypothetical protein